MELVRSFAPNTPAEADDRLDPGTLNINEYNMLPQNLPDMDGGGNKSDPYVKVGPKN